MTVVNNPPVNTIPFDNAHTINYFSKGIDNQGAFFDVEYFTEQWVNTDAFVNFLLGFRTLTGGAGGTITSRGPHQHPLSPNLFCQSAIVTEGFGGPALNANGYPIYNGGAIIRATYRPWLPSPVEMTPNELLQQIDPSTPILWCTQELEGDVEPYSIPSIGLVFTDTGKPTNHPYRFLLPVMNMSLTYHKVPYMPTTVFRSMRGKVNSTTFLGAPQGYVLFKKYRTTRDVQSDGSIAQKLQLLFVERDSNTGAYWNTLPRVNSSGTVEWQQVKATGGSGGNMVTQADLNQLLIF